MNQKSPKGPIDLNTAPLEVLQSVNGIGPVLAGRIVEHRASVGGFQAVDDLLQVPGIGPKLLAKLRPFFTVGESTAVPPGPQERAAEGKTLEAEASLAEGMLQEDEPHETSPAEPLTAAEAAPLRPGFAPEMPTEAKTVAVAPSPISSFASIGFWRGALLVLLGGLLGVLLTLAGAVIYSGTLDYAPRRLVEALSRNMDIMQANQDLTWKRVEILSAQTADLEQRLVALEAEKDTTAERLDAMDEAFDQLETDMATLKGQMADQYAALDERVLAIESILPALESSLEAMQSDLAAMQAHVAVFDAFLSALRDLLLELSPPTVPES